MNTTKNKSSIASKSNNLLLEEIDEALEIALFYGFTPIKHPLQKEDDLAVSKEYRNQVCLLKTNEELESCHRMGKKVCILRTFLDGNFKSLPSPLMVCFRENESSAGRTQVDSLLNLSILGTTTSIAEAIVIKTSLAILSERNSESLTLEINSIGDKESLSRFDRDWANYIRKNLNLLPKSLRDVAKEEPREFLRKHRGEEIAEEFWTNMPKSLNYLSPSSIKHFKEVLEYLEHFNIPYNLNNTLIPNKHYCQHTIFQIKNSDGATRALGVSHQNIARKLGSRKDVPMLSVALKDERERPRKKIIVSKIRPKFFLVQFGYKAKIKSLILLEVLRKAKIPLYHFLIKDKLADQLSVAESLGFPYILIIGEKEALEDSVAIRNTETRVQELVPVSQLVNYLKKI